jgi:hypothetical protein
MRHLNEGGPRLALPSMVSPRQCLGEGFNPFEVQIEDRLSVPIFVLTLWTRTPSLIQKYEPSFGLVKDIIIKYPAQSRFSVLKKTSMQVSLQRLPVPHAHHSTNCLSPRGSSGNGCKRQCQNVAIYDCGREVALIYNSSTLEASLNASYHRHTLRLRPRCKRQILRLMPAQYNREKHGGGCPGERGRVDSAVLACCQLRP